MLYIWRLKHASHQNICSMRCVRCESYNFLHAFNIYRKKWTWKIFRKSFVQKNVVICRTLLSMPFTFNNVYCFANWRWYCTYIQGNLYCNELSYLKSRLHQIAIVNPKSVLSLLLRSAWQATFIHIYSTMWTALILVTNELSTR